MGCNSSTVIPLGEHEGDFRGSTRSKGRVKAASPEVKKLNSTNGLPKKRTLSKSESIIESSEPSVEILLKDTNSSIGDRKIKPVVPPPLAFDVELQEESIIKKHPPKKFRHLTSQQSFGTKILTHEELNNKLQEAEMRRREILNQRIRSAQQRNSQYRQLIHSDVLSQKSEETIPAESTNAW